MQIRKTKNNHLLTKGSQPQNPNTQLILQPRCHLPCCHPSSRWQRHQKAPTAPLCPWTQADGSALLGFFSAGGCLPHEGRESIGKFGVIPRWHVLQINVSLFVCCSFWIFQALTSFARAINMISQIVWHSSGGLSSPTPLFKRYWLQVH